MTSVNALRLLVVDDEPEVLAEVAGYLRRRGELVKTASSCKQALLALGDDAEPIDVLISDGRLQDGSGFQLIRAVKDDRGDGFPCILMTGHVGEHEVLPMYRRPASPG